ncbi:cell division protein ZipA [Microbulbifer guangxiensis]|uniref:cell division protein ZipA n=1 Tax=Microbulbifer guangxiensis TaxID=2904249 RepID=UPI001F02E070|nr:cell division protein ZipA [Microbulbifer guangxiensis]
MGNWLITILALILLLAVLDGARRAYLRHRASLRESDDLSRAMRQDAYDDDEDVLSPARSVEPEADDFVDPEEEARRQQIAAELPGRVRVVQRRALEEAFNVNRQVQESFQSSRKPLAGSRPQREAPEQASLNLDDQVPTLMDSVPVDEGRREPELDESASLGVLESTVESGDSVEQAETTEPKARQAVAEPHQEPAEEPEPAPRPEPRKKPKTTRRERSHVEEVLIINIMAPEGDHFEGNDLLRVLLSSGMRFGEMNIFHYHENGSDDGPVVFSLANMVVPGVFDLGQMEDFTTPGVSLFLALPVEMEAIRAFELMLSVSREIATQLGGELKDENRSVFTAQTAEHYRQRVVEFRRRKALARALA